MIDPFYPALAMAAVGGVICTIGYHRADPSRRARRFRAQLTRRRDSQAVSDEQRARRGQKDGDGALTA